MRAGLLLATLAGLALAALAVGHVGFAPVVAAAARIGWPGFAAFVAYTALPLALLGAAWCACTPGEPWARVPRFVWARTAREAATDVLPFAQFGGLLVGARVLVAAHVAPARAWASMVADLSTELAAQLVFTLYGLGALSLALSLSDAPGAAAPGLWPVLAAGVVLSIAILVSFVAFQRPALRLAGALAERVLPGAARATAGVAQELAHIYTHAPRIAAAFALNLAAWVASAAGAWVALRLMHAAIPLWAVLTIEALIFTLRSAAFMVPGGLGLQEAAYALIGPVFGLDPATALALSLVKRARDLAIAIPVLVAWQFGEGRRLVAG